MAKEQLKKGAKVWCWWKSRYLWYTGQIVNGRHKFVDACDAITMVNEEHLSELEFK